MGLKLMELPAYPGGQLGCLHAYLVGRSGFRRNGPGEVADNLLTAG
jgi:hypothetical protein